MAKSPHMTEKNAPAFLWKPGHGPNAAVLARMAAMFPSPTEPMGEAWFMSEERRMFPQLLLDLDTVDDDEIMHALGELASGPCCFGQRGEWTEWYHFLLPRLIGRNWGPQVYHPVELLVSAFVQQHPDSDGPWPYAGFRIDALQTLGAYIMAAPFWNGHGVPGCLNKLPNGISGWFDADGLLSASLFFCLKYLKPDEVREWFRSVLAISNSHWRAQMVVWLIGAHPLLSGEIDQPARFPEIGSYGVTWDRSHGLAGNYSGDFDEPVQLIPFLPAANAQIALQAARDCDIGDFFEELATNPVLADVAAETAGIEHRFAKLYR
jgi:hypothetical protein